MGLEIDRIIEELKDELTKEAQQELFNSRIESNKWKSKYLQQISNPCTHEHLSLSKDDKGTHMVCSCCLKVMETKASAEAFVIKGV